MDELNTITFNSDGYSLNTYTTVQNIPYPNNYNYPHTCGIYADKNGFGIVLIDQTIDYENPTTRMVVNFIKESKLSSKSILIKIKEFATKHYINTINHNAEYDFKGAVKRYRQTDITTNIKTYDLLNLKGAIINLIDLVNDGLLIIKDEILIEELKSFDPDKPSHLVYALMLAIAESDASFIWGVI
jgi:hypothetical protein